MLPGGPLGAATSLYQATREHAEKQLGVPVVVEVPRLVTLTRDEGLVVVFDASLPRGTDLGSLLGPGNADEVAERVGWARDAGRVHYREALWWTTGPVRGGHGGLPAPPPGERFADWVDADIAMWLIGVALGVFPATASFESVRGIVDGHECDAVTDALYRILQALIDVGILEDDDRSGSEFRWSATVDRTS